MAQIVNRGNVSRDDLIAGVRLLGCSTGSVSDLSFPKRALNQGSGRSRSPYCIRFRRSPILLVLLLALFCHIYAQTKLIRYEDSRVSMACIYSIAAYGTDEQTLKRAVNAVFDEVDRIDRLMSHYKKDSPLSQLNREAAKHPVKIDPELFAFLAECVRYSRESEGAFDITVGPLMKAWGFFRGEGRMPNDDELTEVRKNIGYKHLILNAEEKTIRFARAGVELDLGGIAKGYAVDRVVTLLKQHGIASALISAGGSTIYALGSPPKSDAWEVQIQDPMDARKIAMTVRLKDQALSVSGSAEKFFELHGKRYSHIMDPRTGRPVMGVLSVAVITKTGTAGDALDNVFYVQGVQKSKAYLRRLSHTEVFFFLPDQAQHWRVVHLKNKKNLFSRSTNLRNGLVSEDLVPCPLSILHCLQGNLILHAMEN